jgi:hypothetical protein
MVNRPVVLGETKSNSVKTSPTSILPDGSGGGIWQSGLGPATDGTYVYVETGNGPFDQTLSGGFPANQDFGDSALKLSTTNGLSVSDYFTPFNVVMENTNAEYNPGCPDIVKVPVSCLHSVDLSQWYCKWDRLGIPI